MPEGPHADRAGTSDDVVRGFAGELARLRELHGSPSFARMQAAVRHTSQTAGSKNTFHRMVSHPDRIYGPEYVRGFVLALGLDGAEADAWEQRRIQALQKLQAQRDAAPPDSPEARPSARQPTRRRLVLAAACLTAAIAVTVVIWAGGWATGSPHAPGRLAVADGADPSDSGCARDPAVTTLDRTEVDYKGQPAGSAELRYSPRCGVAWGRFQPFPRAKIPAGSVIHVNVYRPGTKIFEELFQARYVGAAVYGNVLQSTANCVYSGVAIEAAGRELPMSRTRCFRGATPVGNGPKTG